MGSDARMAPASERLCLADQEEFTRLIKAHLPCEFIVSRMITSFWHNRWPTKSFFVFLDLADPPRQRREGKGMYLHRSSQGEG